MVNLEFLIRDGYGDAAAEIKRLRTALQEIVDLDPMTADVLTDDVGPMAKAIAVMALNQRENDNG